MDVMDAMPDVSFSVRYARASSQVYNGGPPGATFPAFFLDAYRNEGYDRFMGAPIQLEREDVLELANAFDRVIARKRGTGPTATLVIANAVSVSLHCQRRVLEETLASARKAASRIPELERQLGISS